MKSTAGVARVVAEIFSATGCWGVRAPAPRVSDT